MSTFGVLGARSIAVVTPYTADVTAPIAEHFTTAGLAVTALGSFLESSDLVVGRISERSIAEGVATLLARTSDCDAVFVSCTSLRLMATAHALEADVGIPVVSSNMALLWHLLRLAGVADEVGSVGRLFTRSLPTG